MSEDEDIEKALTEVASSYNDDLSREYHFKELIMQPLLMSVFWIGLMAMIMVVDDTSIPGAMKIMLGVASLCQTVVNIAAAFLVVRHCKSEQARIMRLRQHVLEMKDKYRKGEL